MIRVFTAEFQQERKAVVKGFTEKTAAINWAKDRIADETIGAVSVWELRTDAPARDALAIAAEGKRWHTDIALIAVVTRRSVRVMR